MITCFGFYGGETTNVAEGIICSSCTHKRRCKALLITDGFDVVAGVIETLLEELEGPTRKKRERLRLVDLKSMNGLDLAATLVGGSIVGLLSSEDIEIDVDL